MLLFSVAVGWEFNVVSANLPRRVTIGNGFVIGNPGDIKSVFIDTCI